MAERAHPEDPAFQHPGWRFRLRRGWIPWIDPPRKNPYREALEWRYAWVSKYAMGKRVLDIPCGSGWGTSMIKGAVQLVGVDLDPESIRFAIEKYGRAASFHVGSMEELQFPADSFDIVSCLEGIEHVPIPVADRFLAESHRVLAPGGSLLLSSPHCAKGGHSGNPYHIHEYQPDEIREKISRFFSIDDIRAQEVGDDIIVHYFRAGKQR
jgi:ubiquinone/menaquinone biosynthesis C-methylase UbiE